MSIFYKAEAKGGMKMAYAIFKLRSINDGKITADLVHNEGDLDIPVDGTNLKFTFVKASELEVNSLEETNPGQFELTFNYKDKL